MKVTISYKPEEEKEAVASVVALCRVLQNAKVRKRDKHAPFVHVYITTERQKGTTCKNGENVV